MTENDIVRTTADLKPDVVKALEQRRRETGEGLSATVNALLRSALVDAPTRTPAFRQRSTPLGMRLDVRTIGEVLDGLDER